MQEPEVDQMPAPRPAKCLGCCLVVAALLSLLAPVGAGAKGPEADAGEAPAGITVDGVGFASGYAGAAGRAVQETRRRAEVIARELHLEVGRPEAVDLPEPTRFGGRGACTIGGTRSTRCRPGPTAVAAGVTFAIVGGGAGGARTVGAYGAAFARIRPRDENRSRSIKRAVFAARRTVTPEAAAAAGRHARTAAAAAGLRLGAIVSVSETSPLSYYGPSFYDSALGTFGAGRFCGIYKRPIARRDPRTGLPRVVRYEEHRRCTFPTSYGVHLEVVYEAER
jgi:hypothetical protein